MKAKSRKSFVKVNNRGLFTLRLKRPITALRKRKSPAKSPTEFVIPVRGYSILLAYHCKFNRAETTPNFVLAP